MLMSLNYNQFNNIIYLLKEIALNLKNILIFFNLFYLNLK